VPGAAGGRARAFALLDRRAAQILSVKFNEVESAEHDGMIVTVPADHFEHGEAVLVTGDRLAVDQA